MVGRVSAVVLAGLLLAAAAAAPDALARRGAGAGAGGGRPGVGCRQQGDCRGDRTGDQARQRLRDGSCLQDPSQCPNPENCPGPGAGTRARGAGKGAVNR